MQKRCIQHKSNQKGKHIGILFHVDWSGFELRVCSANWQLWQEMGQNCSKWPTCRLQCELKSPSIHMNYNTNMLAFPNTFMLYTPFLHTWWFCKQSIFQKALIYFIQGQWQSWDITKPMWRLMETLEPHDRILFVVIWPRIEPKRPGTSFLAATVA